MKNVKIESDKKIDVRGRQGGAPAEGDRAADGGTDPVEVKADSLDLLRENGDTLTVVVAAPQRDGDDELDPAKVIESVRLSG